MPKTPKAKMTEDGDDVTSNKGDVSGKNKSSKNPEAEQAPVTNPANNNLCGASTSSVRSVHARPEPAKKKRDVSASHRSSSNSQSSCSTENNTLTTIMDELKKLTAEVQELNNERENLLHMLQWTGMMPSMAMRRNIFHNPIRY